MELPGRQRSKERPHRGWDRPAGVWVNVGVSAVILALAVRNAQDGRWPFAAVAVAIVLTCAVLPGWMAWRAGHLYRRAGAEPSGEGEPGIDVPDGADLTAAPESRPTGPASA